LAIHSGQLVERCSHDRENTSNFTSTARAGAVKYSRKMKNRLQDTDSRASFTDGVV
jgi:predicted DNA-binding ribbon-helix-helix protein